MAQTSADAQAPIEREIPVRKISRDDLRASLADGYADFKDKRGDLIFVGLLYPLIGLLTAFVIGGGRNLPMLFPLLAGLSLLGPLVATGFYELARRREAGRDSSWWRFFDVFRNPSIISIVAVGIGLLAIFAVWLGSAAIVYAAFFGAETPASIQGFATELFTTPQGWGMIVVGNLIGLAFAAIVLAVSVVSLPLLVDRQVGAGRAVATSLAAFRRNPGVLLRWGVTVAAILFIASIPLFIGLAFALPVLGYATWHLYTRLVDRRTIRTGSPSETSRAAAEA